VGLIVSAKEICNAVDNPGQPYANFVNINDEQADVIAKLENLEWMELDNAELADSSLKFFSGLKKLRYLSLNHNEEITDEGLRHLTSLNLFFLDLSGCKGITNDGLEVLSNLTTLRHLALRDCDGITEEGFEHLRKLTNLQELSVSSENINGFGLVHLKKLPHLKHLGISSGVKKLPLVELMQHLSEFESLKRLFVQHSLTFEQKQELAKAFPNLSYR
jgi:Leucine-rich repeat (LRR) protein